LRHFDFNTLHSADRFSGFDRVGDSNHINLELKKTWSKGMMMHMGQRYALKKNRLCLDAECTGDWLAAYRLSPLLIGVEMARDQALSFNLSAGYLFKNSSWTQREFELIYQADRWRLGGDYKIELDALTDDLLEKKTKLFKEQKWNVIGNWKWDHHWSIEGKYGRKVYDKRFSHYESSLRYQDCCWSVELVGGLDRQGDVNTKQVSGKPYVYLKVNLHQLLGGISQLK